MRVVPTETPYPPGRLFADCQAEPTYGNRQDEASNVAAPSPVYDGTVRLDTLIGDKYTNGLRPNTEEERAAYDAQARNMQRERAMTYGQLGGGSRS